MRLATIFLLFAGLLIAQGSSGVVISQIYGGGGNTGAPLRSDFIELFNRGTSSISIEGWSVQFTSATGTAWQATALQGAIAPGHYFLIREADGANLEAPVLPAPDASGTIAVSSTMAKVALVRNTTLLTGARPTDGAIVDFVGFGETNGFEGSAPASILSNLTATLRRGNGCVDTDDNAKDFQTAAPAPRNSATAPAVDCSAPPQTRSVRISEIQGAGDESPLAGQTVITRGVITAIGTNGLWLQSAPADDDQNAATSEGVFVFFNARPVSTLAPGHLVQVTGVVSEYRPSADPGSAPLTQLVDPSVEILSRGQPLPAAIRLVSGTDWERYEGMRVTVEQLNTVSGTLGFVLEPSATAPSSGVFFGVLPGQPAPYRTPDTREHFETLSVDTRAQGGTAVDVSAGATVFDVIGPLDFASGTYTVIQDVTPLRIIAATPPPSLVIPEVGHFTIAATNLERLFDERDDPSTSEPIVTAEAVQFRLRRISRVFRDVLHAPDVIAVEEVENLDMLNRLAQATGAYDAFLFEGNDIGGIDVGLLVKRSRVRVLSVTQEGKDVMFSGSKLWDRPPLVARLGIEGVALTAIVVHLRSLINADTPSVAAKRRAQAEALRDLVAAHAQSGEEVVVLGDFNMFQFDPLMDVIRSAPGLLNLTDTLPIGENYSYILDGTTQTLDHVLVTRNLKSRLFRYEIAHINAGQAESARNAADGLTRISDHDFPRATFLLDPNSVALTPAAVTNAATFTSTALVPNQIVTLFGRFGAGEQVLFNGTAGQLLYSSATQLSAIVPELGDRFNSAAFATVQLSTPFFGSTPLQIPVVLASPGIFNLGGGQGAILNQDSSINSAANPSVRGSIIQIFGTGGGTLSATSPATLIRIPMVRIGGQPAEVLYAGESPGLGAGVTQINARVPAGIAAGNARIVLTLAGRSSDLNTFVAVR